MSQIILNIVLGLSILGWHFLVNSVTTDTYILIVTTVPIVYVVNWVFFLFKDVSWRCQIDKELPKISFKAFKCLYVVNPDNWSLDNQDCCRYNNGIEDYYVEFETLFDVLRYQWFRKHKNKKDQYLKQLKKQQDFITTIQEDLKIYKKKNNEEVKSRLKKIIGEGIKYCANCNFYQDNDNIQGFCSKKEKDTVSYGFCWDWKEKNK